MDFAVSVQPVAGGFRASTGGPLDLTADGPTADAAVDAVRDQVVTRLRLGEIRVVRVSDLERALEAAARVGENPELDGFLADLAESRRLQVAAPDGG
ncbi:MAG TPA: hypothetical protein VD866_13345 [Urbifossiella sp.]|nr:hypothetical protein [Urbifossiella sp.]